MSPMHQMKIAALFFRMVHPDKDSIFLNRANLLIADAKEKLLRVVYIDSEL